MYNAAHKATRKYLPTLLFLNMERDDDGNEDNAVEKLEML